MRMGGAVKVAHLSRGIHPSRSKHKFMLSLSAYFDESGHADDPDCQFVGVGGLCAPAAAWNDLDDKWQGILNEQCDGKPFHMNKFALQQGPVVGGQKNEENMLGSLIRTIKE